MKVFKKILLTVLIILSLVFMVYIITPKKAVKYYHGAWIATASIEVCRCYGISKGITNKWLSEFEKTGGNPSYMLKDNDYCVGINLAPCLVTNKGFEEKAFANEITE